MYGDYNITKLNELISNIFFIILLATIIIIKTIITKDNPFIRVILNRIILSLTFIISITYLLIVFLTYYDFKILFSKIIYIILAIFISILYIFCIKILIFSIKAYKKGAILVEAYLLKLRIYTDIESHRCITLNINLNGEEKEINSDLIYSKDLLKELDIEIPEKIKYDEFTIFNKPVRIKLKFVPYLNVLIGASLS